MQHRKIRIGLFILLAMVQLYAGARMILSRENVLNNGKTYAFAIAPIDPSDPFRGKYLTLSFEENHIEVEDLATYAGIEKGYAVLEVDEAGLAHVSKIHLNRPNVEYLEVRLTSTNIGYDSINYVYFKFPFDRYYLTEFEAKRAEDIFAERETQSSTNLSYVQVRILNGEAVLEDLFIDGSSIQTLLDADGPSD